MFKKILIGFLLFILFAAILIFRPVPIVKEEKALVVKGEVIGVFEGGVKDVVFLLKDNPQRYYINRGLENGLNLHELKKNLMGREITLKYPKYWTPLDWNNRIRHVSKLEFNGEVLFNELK